MKSPPQISLKEAFLYWLKLGFISFGGPAGQISIMYQDLVENKRWISKKRFLHALNFCMLLPGPEAQQLATYIGWLMHKTLGGLIAGLLFVLPSFFILVLLGFIYMSYGELPIIKAIFSGIKPAVVAIVLFAAFRIGQRTLHNFVLSSIAVASFIAIFFFKLPFPLIVFSAALIGWVGSHWHQKYFDSHAHTSIKKDTQYQPCIIDDHTAIPSHAKYNSHKLIKILVFGLSIGVMTAGALIYFLGFEHLLSQTAIFFSKTALLTFGGAYAVLPYVYQGVIEHYHWISPQQMIDALALGETTPGPLIMVITFIGFVSGWVNNFIPNLNPIYAALLTTTVATFFTFLPSFIMIFVGAPFIESTRKNIKFAAPLSAITSAVVGVILNLALFFAYHVFWNEEASAISYVSVLMTLISLIALIRFKVNTLYVIFVSCIAGIVLSLL
ncbi:MAG: chromate efflux transporter [Gammaproteobacteria bacterium]|nr:chromate efflux transporter [Gammaproteobacteria bacterium]